MSAPRSVGPQFEASYYGDCARCPERIEPGDLVRYIEGELVHVRHRRAPENETPVEVCDRCWLVQPCDCHLDD